MTSANCHSSVIFSTFFWKGNIAGAEILNRITTVFQIGKKHKMLPDKTG